MILEIVEQGQSKAGNQLLSEKSVQEIRKRFGLQTGTFQVLLMEKTGSEAPFLRTCFDERSFRADRTACPCGSRKWRARKNSSTRKIKTARFFLCSILNSLGCWNTLSRSQARSGRKGMVAHPNRRSFEETGPSSLSISFRELSCLVFPVPIRSKGRSLDKGPEGRCEHILHPLCTTRAAGIGRNASGSVPFEPFRTTRMREGPGSSKAFR